MDASLTEIVRSMRRHPFVVVMCVAGALAAAAFAYKRQAPVYVASVTLGPSESRILLQASSSSMNDVSFLEIQRIAALPDVASRAVARAGIKADAAVVAGSVSVKAASDPQLVEIRVPETSRARALALADGYGAEVIAADAASRRTAAAEVLRSLDAAMKARRDEVEAILGRIQSENRQPTPSEEVDVRTLQNAYALMASRSDDTSLNASTELLQVWDRPSIVRADVPSALAFGLSALLIGLILGAVIAAGADGFGRVVTDSATLGAIVDKPILGDIPLLNGDDQGRALYMQAHRLLRAKLLRLTRDGRRKVIMLVPFTSSSAIAQVVAHVAVSLGRSGRRLTLVSATGQHEIEKAFGIREDAPGLGELLAGKVRLENVLLRTSVPVLRILPAGDLGPEHSDLLDSPAMTELAQSLRSAGDLVLIATEPLGDSADPVVLSQLADGVVLLGQRRPVDRQEVRNLLGMLGDDGAEVLGLVVFDADHNGKHAKAAGAHA